MPNVSQIGHLTPPHKKLKGKRKRKRKGIVAKSYSQLGF